MKVDPRFKLAIQEHDGQKTLRFSAAAELAVDEAVPLIAQASFDELCELAAVPAAAREAFLRRRSTMLFSNGWQSWSFGGELGIGERVKRARIVTKLDIYNDRPAVIRRRDEVLSHFLTFIRSGERRLFIVSRGSIGAALPPVSFRINRRSLGLKIEVYAKGARFAAGEPVAELRLFYREGYFAAKETLRAAFREYGHFDRLAFLGHGGSLMPGGYESWYNHYLDIDDAIISRDLEHIAANDNLINAYYIARGKPTVFQIDDGWERSVGEWDCDDAKFPRGMKAVAADIEERGLVPGIWIAPLLVTKGSALYRTRPDWLLLNTRGKAVLAGWNPGWDGDFYCLDLSNPEVEAYIVGLFDKLVEDWGYRFIKLDFLYAGFLQGRHAKGGAAYRHYDRIMRRITSRTTNSRGEPVAYLGCGAPLEPSFRHFPLMRIGADTKETWEYPQAKFVRHQGRPAAYVNLSGTIGRSIFDGSIFVNDPDVIFCRTRGMGYGEKEKELIALVDFLLASQIMFSDDTHEFGDPEELALTARIVELYDRLAGREYGAERVARNVYRVFSRDGRVKGLVNLSERPFSARGAPAAGYDPAKAIVIHARRREGILLFEPRSISLFEE